MAPANNVADDLFRREGARLVALLTAQFGTHRLQLAEDVVQEALVRALQTWPYRGIPDNPAAWLAQAARNLALDALRREQRWQDRQDGVAQAQERWHSTDAPAADHGGTFADDTLRMLFVCCHPQLSPEARTALALRTLCGFSPAEIAAAFLTGEAAIAKRLVRARQRIRELELPFALPAPSELPARFDGVLTVLYLLFNEGHKASGGDRLVRAELCHEAVRLAELLAAHPATALPRTHALLALLLPALHGTAVPANILFILVDDLGTYDLGCTGATEVRTPRIDRLASEGVRFTDYYAAAPICSPSRAGLLTGRYPRRFGMETWVQRADSTRGIPRSELTLGELFRANGYATACIGKWHVGFTPELLPRARGFDHHFGQLHNLDPVETVYFDKDGGVQFVVGGGVNGRRIFGQYPDMYAANPLDLGRGRLIPTLSVDQYLGELALWLGVSKSNLNRVLPNIGNFYSTNSSAPPLGFLL